MEFEKKIELIVSTLKKSKQVTSLDRDNDIEAYNIAHALFDIEEAAKTITELRLKLESNTLGEMEINDVLTDIGDELRHILYHIKDMKYYDYLIE